MMAVKEMMQMVPLWVWLLLIAGPHLCDGQAYQTKDWPDESVIFFELGGQLSSDAKLYYKTNHTYDGVAFQKFQPMFTSKPGAIVYPATVGDVQAALAFARKYRIYPTVRSTGHSFLGRSSGEGTLLISLQNMRDISADLNDAESPSGSSLTTQTGNDWITIYEEADKHNKVVVGGSAKTVSPGGYFLAAGHSPISRSFGLGSDNLLRIWIVLADGTYANVTDPNNGDTWVQYPNGTVGVMSSANAGELWWMLRGGGLSVGIVIAYKFQMHPSPGEVQQLVLSCGMFVEPFGNIGAQAIGEVAKFITNDLSNKWGGYILSNGASVPYGTLTLQGTVTVSMNYLGPRDEALQDIQALNESVKDKCTVLINSYDSFYRYEIEAVNDPIVPRLTIFSKFLRPNEVSDINKWTRVVTGLWKLDKEISSGFSTTTILLGGKVAENKGVVDSAASPDFREALLSLAGGVGWEKPERDEYMMEKFEEWMKKSYDGIGKGTYSNEANIKQSNWQVELWGSQENYDRLLQAKKKFDPDGMFWCNRCVGSETGGYVLGNNANTVTPSLAIILSLTSVFLISVFFCL